jgi:multidrug resistance efflux pump
MMAANGFTKAEVKQIQEGIEKGKTELKNAEANERSNETQMSSGTTVSIADELKKLKDLVDAGVITSEEFDQQKRKMLGQ